MRVHKDSKRFIACGDDLPDVQRWLRNTPPTWTRHGCTSSQSMDSFHNSKSWDFGVGYGGALKLAENGWSEGAKDLSDRLAAHMPNRDHVDSWRYDVAGELPDIGRYLAGDPTHMKRHGHPKGHKPIISLLVNICCSASVGANSFANYGAAMCSVIDQLENSGRRVELNVVWVSLISGVRVCVGWTAKRAEDSLDLASVAFSLAHPAASRRLGFAMCERSSASPTPGYGMTVDPTEEDWIDPLPGTYCIQGVGYGGSSTLEAALRQVTEEINRAAGEELVTMEG